MKNIIHPTHYFVVGLLILSSVTVLATPNPQSHILTAYDTVSLTAPSLTVVDGQTTISVGTSQDSSIPGEPLLPVLTKTYEFPLRTTIISATAVPISTSQSALSAPIAMVPRPLIDSVTTVEQPTPSSVYSQDQLYPASWSSYKLTGGLNHDNVPTAFLTITLHPVRYNPIQSEITYASSFSITIQYQLPSKPLTLGNETSLVIITTNSYKSLVKPLVDHKIAHGVSTKTVTITDITKGTYFPVEGRDTAEKMKYFIKAAHENWGTLYVLLMGSFQWVPTRSVLLETDTGSVYQELDFPSDLYFADLYNGTGSFCSWDSNNNGKYGEWPYPEGHAAVDIMDLVPDVHVGRLACLTKAEVRTAVDKVILYETTAHNASWFSRMVVAGGDTFDKAIEGGTDYNEGEVTTQAALDVMTNFTGIKLYTSLHNITLANMTKEINTGAGFIYVCGHGSPRNWATHYNGDYGNWTDGLSNKAMKTLTNDGKCAVLMVGGCHNSEIDVTPMNMVRGILREGLGYFKWSPEKFGEYYLYNYVPETWSWCFVKDASGAMATMGSSGYGCVQVGDNDHDGVPDCTQYFDGWFEINFFKLYSQDHVVVLGQTYDQDVTGYVTSFPTDTSRYDAKVMATHVLLGDPSLLIGGYD
jgi:hypothetical protein